MHLTWLLASSCKPPREANVQSRMPGLSGAISGGRTPRSPAGPQDEVPQVWHQLSSRGAFFEWRGSCRRAASRLRGFELRARSQRLREQTHCDRPRSFVAHHDWGERIAVREGKTQEARISDAPPGSRRGVGVAPGSPGAGRSRPIRTGAWTRRGARSVHSPFAGSSARGEGRRRDGGLEPGRAGARGRERARGGSATCSQQTATASPAG